MRRPNTPTIMLCFIALAAAGAFVLAPSLRAAPLAQQLNQFIYMPMVMKEALPVHIPKMKTVAATQTPTLTPTPPPTLTSVPSATPTIEKGGATIKGFITVDGTPGALGLGDGFGPGLLVRDCVEPAMGEKPECGMVARTGIADAEGNFEFTVQAPVDPGHYYQVNWRNEGTNSGSPFAGSDQWLSAYYSDPITDIQADDNVDVGRLELANIIIEGPSNGVGSPGLPIEFVWTERASEIGTYRWSFAEAPIRSLDDREKNHFFPTNKLPGRSYLMRSYPPGTKIGQDWRYFWYIRVDFPQGGFGESYYARMLWFTP